ncbi:hypothetical protein MOQ_000792, partial [Trypanosoma cruzi marinkellei]
HRQQLPWTSLLMQSSHREQKEECVGVCREHSDCHRQRRPSWHRPSRVSTHRATHAPGRAKQRGETNDPKSGQHLHAWRASCSRRQPAPSKIETEFLQNTVQILVCVCLLEEHKTKEEHREAHQHSKRHSWMAAIHAVRPNLNNHARWQHTPVNKKQKEKRKTRRQGVAVCVWRCECLPALAANKTKQEGKKYVLRPTGPRRTPTRHGSLSARCVAAPPHACSRRGAQGRRHERVGGCASGAVGRETHGTPHRKSAATNKKKRESIKKKTSMVIAHKRRKKRWGVR